MVLHRLGELIFSNCGEEVRCKPLCRGVMFQLG